MTNINENNITFRQIKSYLEEQGIDIASIEAPCSKLTSTSLVNDEKEKLMTYFTIHKNDIIAFCNAHNLSQTESTRFTKIM
mgnify:FL=1